MGSYMDTHIQVFLLVYYAYYFQAARAAGVFVLRVPGHSRLGTNTWDF